LLVPGRDSGTRKFPRYGLWVEATTLAVDTRVLKLIANGNTRVVT